MSTATLKALKLTPGDDAPYYYDEASNFGVRLSVRAAHMTPEHAHDNIQISIPVDETSVEVSWQTADGALHQSTAQRGDAMIIPPHQQHKVSWKNRALFVNLHIGTVLVTDKTDAFLAAILRVGETHVVKDQFLASFGENVLSLITREVRFDENLMRAFRLMIEAHIVNTYASPHVPIEAGEVTSVATRRAAFMAVPRTVPLDLTSAKPCSVPPIGHADSGLAPWQLRKVATTIEADLRRDHSVADLAALVDLSKGHFSRAFRSSTGLSPRQWIIQKRVKLAISKLAHTDESLADIAQNCGFAEQSHFTRTFTQVTGTSPGAWRRAHKI